MEADKKSTITQAGSKLLERLFGKKVRVRGPHGESVVEPGPTVIEGVVRHTENLEGGKVTHKPDSDGQPT